MFAPKRLLRVFVSMLIAWACQDAGATVTTTTFQVTATVASNCIASATNLGFGTYDPLAASPAASTSQITVRCTLGTAYSIGLDAGIGSGATVTVRRMTQAAATLNYGLFQDSGHATVWGNTPGTDTVSGTGTGLSINHTVYGQVPAGQNVTTGGYADTITVSINY